MRGRIWPSLALGVESLVRRKLAAMPAVKEVDQQPDRQPDKEAHPGEYGQPQHQQKAEEHAEQRDDRAARAAESAAAIWFLIAQDNHARRDQYEREECADVGEVRKGADIQKA